MKLNKKGQGMSEYLIILALVAIATIGAVIFFADNVREQIANIAQELTGEVAGVSHDTYGREGAATAQYELENFVESDG